MRAAATIALLRRIEALIGERRDLVTGLRESDLPGAEPVAAALAAGRTLPESLAAVTTPALARRLAGPGRDLAAQVALLADELDLRDERRDLLLTAVTYPTLCILALAGMCWWLAANHAIEPHPGWLAAAGVALAVVASTALPWPVGWSLGPLTAWRREAAAARRYARAAIVARWRLPEAEAALLLGRDLEALLPMLGHDQAELSCRRLSEHHRQRARRGARGLALALGVLLYLLAGVVALSAGHTIWGGFVETVEGSLTTD